MVPFLYSRFDALDSFLFSCDDELIGVRILRMKHVRGTAHIDERNSKSLTKLNPILTTRSSPYPSEKDFKAVGIENGTDANEILRKAVVEANMFQKHTWKSILRLPRRLGCWSCSRASLSSVFEKISRSTWTAGMVSSIS